MQIDNIIWHWKKSAKRKHIALHVDDGGALEVRTPIRTSQRRIEALIMEKRAWIERSVSIQQQRIHPKLPAYQSCGKLYLYGVAYDYEVASALKSSVLVADQKILIKTPSQEAFEKVLKDWYKQKTKQIVQESLDDLKVKLSTTYKAVGYRYYKRRLGSCDSNNNLMFNSLLAVHKKEHIRYVVAHELAHIKEKNHSVKFYAEGERILQGFKNLHKEMRA